MIENQKIIIIADTFPPFRNSAAIQLYDLAIELTRQGHNITVMIPAENLECGWKIEDRERINVLMIRVPRMKGVNNIRRTLAELAMPFIMKYYLNQSPLAKQKWDGVIWYSPSIFFGPLVKYIKRKSSCKSYLIIRDIFPDWAVDLGLMKRGIVYHFFAKVAKYQYAVADTIGVQSEGNKIYFLDWVKKPGRQLEVLPNWLGKNKGKNCSINLSRGRLAGRKLFVYAGNMGVAQGMEMILRLAHFLNNDHRVGFVFVGRGSSLQSLKELATLLALQNVEFYDEIPSDQIPRLYEQCSVGVVALAKEHKSHNIPGKFLTYLQAGLPVFALLNSGNDLASIIQEEDVGVVCESYDLKEMHELVLKLITNIDCNVGYEKRCRDLLKKRFNVEKVVGQLLHALKDNENRVKYRAPLK